MVNYKKGIAAVSAMVMCAALAGCGGSSTPATTTAPAAGGETTTAAAAETTKAAEETTAATMKEEDASVVQDVEIEDADTLENPTLKWLSWWDINPSGDAPKGADLELFETKYGGKIEFIETTWDTRWDDLGKLVASGDSPDMYPGADLDAFPARAIQMVDPIDDIIDVSSPDIPKGAKQIIDMCSVNGKHYLACANANAGFIMIYNKKTLEENGLDDPAELAYNNEWTWDKFKEMCYDFADRDEDKFAIDGWWYEAAMVLSTGKPIIGTENGVMTNNLMSKELERVENFFLDFKNDDVFSPLDEWGWTVKPERMAEGKTLFYPIGRWGLQTTDYSQFGEVGDVMFVPTPRDPEADEWYVTAQGGLEAFLLCKGAKNPEAVGAWYKCVLAKNKDEGIKEVAEKQLREDYHWTDEMIEMDKFINDLTNAHPMIDFYQSLTTDDLRPDGFNPRFADAITDASHNGKDWYTTREEIGTEVQTHVDDINEKLKNLN